jgi:bifunctional ADP-heptose synthase (sugar kinase/adenylyltransferase)
LPDLDLQLQLSDYIRQQIPTVDAVVCSDYGDGVLTNLAIESAVVPGKTIVDAQTNLQRYSGALLFTPNLPEAEQAVGYAIKSPQTLMQAGRDLLNLTQAQKILITRGEEGMSLFERVNGEAAVLGNLAASIVVRQFGTATTTADEMKEALKTMIAI